MFKLTDILNEITESNAVDFDRHIKNVSYQRGNAYVRAKVYTYNFEVFGVRIKCVIYPNEWTVGKYICSFVANDGSTKDRVGKDLRYMNTVMQTVADCILDAIEDNDSIRVIQFDGSDDIRDRAYIRFFSRHPDFSKFQIDSSREYSGYVEIDVRNNQ